MQVALVAVLAAAGMQLATGAPAAAVRTVYYDASRTGVPASAPT